MDETIWIPVLMGAVLVHIILSGWLIYQLHEHPLYSLSFKIGWSAVIIFVPFIGGFIAHSVLDYERMPKNLSSNGSYDAVYDPGGGNGGCNAGGGIDCGE